jgi:serine/threonine protein phosphatase PrpC/CRP-like cAMP-binding protein
MRVVGFGRTDVGRKRNHNEDFFLSDDALGLYIVCDGMGGHASGEVASEMAANTVMRALRARRDDLEAFDDRIPGSRNELARIVESAVQDASRRVFDLATSQTGRAGMGTTLTMLLMVKGVGVMGHVGDSRLYMRRGGRLHPLSEDHTYVNEMVKRGAMTLEEAKAGPYANVITRAVGIQSTVRVDTLIFDVVPGDTYLLCSDGLTKHMTDADELARILDNDHLNSIATQLVDVANARGGSDNVTTLVLRAQANEEEDAVDRNRTTELNLRIDTLKHVSIFKHLEMTELCKVLNVVHAIEVKRGDVVIREGEKGGRLYAILDGKLAIVRGNVRIRELGSGSHFGEMALFNNRPRSATVSAIENSRLLVMERDRFNELVRDDAVLGVKLLWSLAQVLSLRLDDTSDRVFADNVEKTSDVNVSSPFANLGHGVRKG